MKGYKKFKCTQCKPDCYALVAIGEDPPEMCLYGELDPQPKWVFVSEPAVQVDTDADALTSAISMLSTDMHMVSMRPCETCKTMSDVLGKPFGCHEWQKYRRSKRTT